MEIPVINRMTEFETSINSLNDPSLITRLFSVFELAKSSLPHRMWKWGALFLALAYAFSSLAYRLKFLILHYHNKSKSLLATASEPLLSHFDLDDDVSSDEDDDISASDDDDECEGDTPSSSYEDLTRFDDDFQVKGSFGYCGQYQGHDCNFKLRRRRSVAENFSLSDLVNGNGVVKLWENSILGEIEFPTVTVSPSVILSAGGGEDGVLGLGLWDLRMNRRSEAIKAEWRSDRRCGSVRVMSSRTGNIYVNDDVGVRVGDVRKLDTPLADLTEFEEEKWWDADGGNVTNDSTRDLGE